MKRNSLAVAWGAAALVLAGCGGSGAGTKAAAPTTVTAAAAAADAQHNKLCEVSAWRRDAVAGVCKPGQKVVFLPETFGNEQLPVIFAAVNCDLRYQVALTRGAVTCIYGPIDVAAAPAPAADASAPAK